MAGWGTVRFAAHSFEATEASIFLACLQVKHLFVPRID
jgi:hypothetical protein